jgi:hypothetical protein
MSNKIPQASLLGQIGCPSVLSPNALYLGTLIEYRRQPFQDCERRTPAHRHSFKFCRQQLHPAKRRGGPIPEGDIGGDHGLAALVA